MTLTERLRDAVRAGRREGESIRDYAGRLGVPHMTLHRFLSGSAADGPTLDALDAALAPLGDSETCTCSHARSDHGPEDADFCNECDCWGYTALASGTGEPGLDTLLVRLTTLPKTSIRDGSPSGRFVVDWLDLQAVIADYYALQGADR